MDDGLVLKLCKTCNIEKDLTLFIKSSESKNGYGGRCKECSNAKQREDRKKSGDQATKRYEKTKGGYLMRSYRNMLSRVSGVQVKKAHLYEGLDILTKEEFYNWSINDETFNSLFDGYQESDYDMRLAPSVDREDSSLGYNLDNMRWLHHWRNSQLGALSKHNKEN